MMRAMQATILDKRWKIKFANIKDYGICDPDAKIITIRNNLNDKELLDTIIHEALHSASFDVFDEIFVTRLATDIARILFRLGYHRGEII